MELTTYCRTVFVAIDEERRAVPCPTWVPANASVLPHDLRAIDAERRAVPCPTWVPVNDEDRALDAHAVELVRIRERFGD